MIKYTQCILLFFFNATAFSVDNPLKVFVLVGQSNMVGKRSKIEELPNHLKTAQKEVLVFHPTR